MTGFVGHIFEQVYSLSLRPAEALRSTYEDILRFHKKVSEKKRDRLVFYLVGLSATVLFLVSAQEAWSFFVVPSVASQRLAISTGEGTKQLLSNLLVKESMDSRVVARVRRQSLFSVEGVVVALGGDSVQMFEYPDASTASKEAKAFFSQYKEPRWKNAWKPSTRLYQKDALIVYYMGADQDVISKLDKTVGLSSAGGVAFTTSTQKLSL